MRAMDGTVGVLLIMSLTLLGASPAPKRAKYEFKQNYAPGDRFQVVINSSMNVELSATSAGQVVARSSGRDSTASRMTMTVVEVNEGVPIVELAEFDPNCATITKKPGNGQEVKLPAPFAGRAVTLRRAPDGSVAHDYDGKATQAVLEQFRGLLERDADFYPPKPVSVRDRWDIGAKLSRRIRSITRGNVTGFATLQSVKDVNGAKQAEVWISIAAMGVRDGVQVALSLEGPAEFDLRTGRMIRVDLKGEVDASSARSAATRSARAGTMSGVGSGTIAYRQTSRRMTPDDNIARAASRTPVAAAPTAAAPIVQQVAMVQNQEKHDKMCPCPCKHRK